MWLESSFVIFSSGWMFSGAPVPQLIRIRLTEDQEYETYCLRRAVDLGAYMRI